MPFADVNGVKIYYEIYGEGEPVVFIHGIGVTLKVWEFQREAISKQFKMIAYDLRGSGRSSKTPEVKHTAELMGEDLKGLLDYLNIGKVSVVGLSLGAAIAMKFAIENPNRVKNLVLSGAFADLKGILRFASRYFPGLIGRMLMFKFFGELATKIMLPSAPRPELLHYHSNIIRIDKDEVVKYRQILNSYTITSVLSKIICPTLILYGAREPVLHKYGRLIRSKIENSCMEIVPGVGHGWNGEKPALFNQKVMEFIYKNNDSGYE